MASWPGSMRGKDYGRMKRALAASQALSRRVEGWSGVEEIRRWRESRPPATRQ